MKQGAHGLSQDIGVVVVGLLGSSFLQLQRAGFFMQPHVVIVPFCRGQYDTILYFMLAKILLFFFLILNRHITPNADRYNEFSIYI